MPWTQSVGFVIVSHNKVYCLDNFLFKLILLEMTAEANKVDEMMNSPEIKPKIPVRNIIPVKMSL